MNLNEKQKEAVEYGNGPLLIIAGAGTGKTAVITQRIVNIINKGLAKPNEILALTFTDKAADEMLGRVDENLPLSYGDIWISTFHSFCDRILRQEGHYIGLDTNYSMMSTAQGYIFFRKHLFELPLDRFRPKGNPTKFINDLLKHFSRLQDEDVSTEQYLEFAKNLPQKTEEEKEEYLDINELAKVYERYTQLKIGNSKIDFGDLIIFTIELFRKKPNVLKKYQNRFKYILVDEFQDTNYTQNVLVNILAGLDPSDAKKNIGKISPNLTVVGDDDQAIYKFRGAAISNILQFKQYYPMAKEVVLTENYRSRQEILDSSYALISNNNPHRLEITEKIEKRLISKGDFKPEENVVNLVTALTEDAEGEWIAKEILELTGHSQNVLDDSAQKYDKKGQSTLIDSKEEGKYKFKDIAILVRANSQSESIVQNLRYLGVPYKLGGSRGLYSRDEVKRLISFLRILVDYSDEISMFNILMMKEWFLTPREFIQLNMLARENRNSVFEQLELLWGVKLGQESGEIGVVQSNIADNILKEDSKEGVTKLLNILNKSIKMIMEEKSVGEILYDFVKESGYIENLVDQDTSQSQFMVGNISKFFDITKDYEKENSESNIYEYVDYINYAIDVGDSPLVDQSDMEDYDAVNVMTVHGAKGLEFPVVFLVNLVSDRFPSRNRNDTIPINDALIKESLTGLEDYDEHLQEERRLFYVGATRAKDKLYLTAANFYGNAKRKKKATIFLHELLSRDVSNEFDNPMVIKKNNGGLELEVNKKEEGNTLEDLGVKIKKLSYSQINTFERCPKQYKYAYIYKIPTKSSSALSFGSSLHNTLKDFYTLLLRSKEGLGITDPPTYEDLNELFEKNWISAGYQSKQHEVDRKESGIKVLYEYFNKIYSPDENPFKIEEGFTVHIGDIAFVGKIDRMDLVKMEDGVPVVQIIDYKTGGVKSDSDIKNDLQLPLYALFAQKALGVKVTKAKYIFVEHNKEIEVDISDVRKAKAEVTLLKGVNEILKGNFNAIPGFNCQYCDYKDICEDATL